MLSAESEGLSCPTRVNDGDNLDCHRPQTCFKLWTVVRAALLSLLKSLGGSERSLSKSMREALEPLTLKTHGDSKAKCDGRAKK